MKANAEIISKLGWSGFCVWLFMSLGCSWQVNKVLVEENKTNNRSMPAREILYLDFRQACENLDFASLKTQELDNNQRALIAGLQQVLGGEVSAAEMHFRELAALAPAGWIKNYAAEVLVNLLYFQAKWKSLLALLHSSAAKRDVTDKQNFPLKELGLAGSEYCRFPEQPVILTLELSPSGTPLIPLWVNGQKKKFWLDSGAAFSVLSSELARQLNILPINSQMISAATGTTKKVLVRMTIIASIKIGALAIANHPAMIVPKKDLYFKIPGFFHTAKISKIINVNGILGMNAIKNMNVRIDFKNKKIIIAKPENKRPAERNLFWLGYPIVICRSMDSVPLYFGLDTGAKKSILSSSIFSKLSPMSTYQTRMKVWGAGGDVKISAQVLPSLKIVTAGHMVSFKDITVLPPNPFGLVSLDGILGMDFVAGCGNLTIDLQNGVLALNDDH